MCTFTLYYLSYINVYVICDFSNYFWGFFASLYYELDWSWVYEPYILGRSSLISAASLNLFRAFSLAPSLSFSNSLFLSSAITSFYWLPVSFASCGDWMSILRFPSQPWSSSSLLKGCLIVANHDTTEYYYYHHNLYWIVVFSLL